MEQRFSAGDFLFFQIESGFALIRLLSVEETNDGIAWHIAAFHDLFPDVEIIETAVSAPDKLSISIPHIVLSNRAFESTQVAKIGFSPLTDQEDVLIRNWSSDPDREISDLSVRLLTGLR